MQYDINMPTYSEVKDDRMINFKKYVLKLLVILFGGICISRLSIVTNNEYINEIAPFGIAYLISIMLIKYNSRKDITAAFIGVILGYFSMHSIQYMNILASTFLYGYGLVINRNSKKNKILSTSFIIFMSYFLYGVLFNGYILTINLLTTTINTLIIIPVYCIIRYSIESLKEINEDYFYSTEEIISVGILIALTVCGIGELNVYDVYARNILSYLLVLVVGYSAGAGYGASMGVVIGLIVGINSENIMQNVGIYGILGLTSGIFKDVGKIFSVVSFILTFLAINIYYQNISVPVCIEGGVSLVLFFIVPHRFIEFISLEVSLDRKRDKINRIELNQLKDEFIKKVDNLKDALGSVSVGLNSFSDFQNMYNNDKAATIIGSLADRVCSRCSRCDKCWKNEFSITYNSFESLIKSCEDKNVVFPNYLEKICINKEELINKANYIVINLKGSDVKRECLEEGRLMVANYMKNMSFAIDKLLSDFKRDVVLCTEIEKTIKKAFIRQSIQYRSLLCYRDNSARLKIKMTIENKDVNSMSEFILDVINSIVNKPMTISAEECRMETDRNEYVLIFEEVPKYQLVSYGAIKAKDGEDYIGDTYTFGKTKDGKYMTMISDGMGHGINANKESSVTINIIEKFLEDGFDINTAVNMVNTVMGIKFSEDERFSTLDLSLVDLYSGDVEFMKVGAPASFIKSGKKITRIESNMPPFGLADELEMESIKGKIKGGDLIIIVSDGVLDANRCNIGIVEWMEEYLSGASNDPKLLAQKVIEKAKEFNNGNINDDMTVVVSKVYELF